MTIATLNLKNTKKLSNELRNGKSVEFNIANSIWLNKDYYAGSDAAFSPDFEAIVKTAITALLKQ